MYKVILLTLLFTLLPIRSFNPQSFAQPAVEEHDASEEVEVPQIELRGVMILRVSERYLEELFARDINKRTPVTRVVLGTHATGTAHTKGRADVDTKADQDNASFNVKISGSTDSRTVGRNGPAIIHSRSITTWTAKKIVRFDGEEFVTTPGTIESSTKIIPLGADSTLPGIRGRLVSRIATRRAIECNSTAERISGEHTDKQVLADVDRIVDQQIAKLNKRIENRPLMSVILPKLNDAGVQFSTSSNCINVSFAGGDASPLAKVCPVEGIDPSDTELWFQTALIASPDGSIPEAIDNAGAWLAEQLPDVGIPGVDLTGEDGVLPVNVQVIDGWVLIRSQNPETQADVQADSEELPEAKN